VAERLLSTSNVKANLSNTRPVTAVRRRYSGSMAEKIGHQLSALDFANQATLLGAGLLASLIPLLVLLSSFSNQRVADRIALRLGLDHRATHIVGQLFHNSTPTLSVATVSSFIFVTMGVVAVASSLQQIYEKAFRQPHQRHLLRLLIWVLALCVALTIETLLARSVHSASGHRLLAVLITFVLLTPFFWWTIHYLLGDRVSWRRTFASALITGALWAAFAVGSELYFSTTIIVDSRTFGAIGAVLALLTWLIGIGLVIILGALAGVVWIDRRSPEQTEPASPPISAER
jgi:membrane protein